MKRFFLVAILVIAAVLPAIGQTGSKNAYQQSNVEQEMKQIERELSEAYIQNNVAAIDRLLADDYIGTTSRGEVKNKAQVLALYKSGDIQVVSVNKEDMKVRAYGDVAVVTGRFTSNERYEGQDFSGQYRFLHVFVKHRGRWRMTTNQTTTVPQK